MLYKCCINYFNSKKSKREYWSSFRFILPHTEVELRFCFFFGQTKDDVRFCILFLGKLKMKFGFVFFFSWQTERKSKFGIGQTELQFGNWVLSEFSVEACKRILRCCLLFPVTFILHARTSNSETLNSETLKALASEFFTQAGTETRKSRCED